MSSPNQQPAHSPELILLQQSGETKLSGFTVVVEKERMISRAYFAYSQDAELFVKACNSHQALVYALKAVDARLLKGVVESQPNLMEQDCHRIINEALRSATQ